MSEQTTIRKCPPIVLREWTDKVDAPVILTVKIFLTADCHIVGLKLEPETGFSLEAAMASYKLAQICAAEFKP